MEIKQRAKLAIERGEQWKNATLAGLMPEFDAAEIENIQAIDPPRGLVHVSRDEGEALVDAAPEGDKLAANLRRGLLRSKGAESVLWQAGDVLALAGEPVDPMVDPTVEATEETAADD